MSTKSKILIVGSLVMDLIVSTTRFPERGETVLGNNYTTAPGGKGANQAVQAARLGALVDMVGRVGDDSMGREMLESLKKSKVDIKNISIDKNTHSAIGNVQLEIHEGKTNNRIIVVSGANMETTPKDIEFLKEKIADYDIVIMQHEIPLEINEAVLEYANSKGIKTMVNPAPSAQIKSEVMPYITYIAPNEHEAEDLTGIKVIDESSAKKAIESLLSQGVKNVIITLGSEGAVFGNDKEFFFSPSIFTENVVDPTAAGDSFIGAFAYAITSGASHKEAMLFSNITAHITIKRMGAQPSLPTLEEVKNSIKENGFVEEQFKWL